MRPKSDMGLVQLRERKHGVCFAEQIGGHTGLGEDSHGPRKLAGMPFDVGDVGVKACKDKDSAVGQLAGEVLYEVKTISTGHDQVAEEEMGAELPGAIKALFCGVA